MPDLRRRRCQRCGKTAEEVGPISWRGLCVEDAKRAVAENVVGLATMTNPARDRWRRGVAASVGAVILDDLHEGT
jgi:hypothetical protein